MNKWLNIIIGTILFAGILVLILPSMPLETWGKAALTLIKGGIVILALIVSLILIILGINELKE